MVSSPCSAEVNLCFPVLLNARSSGIMNFQIQDQFRALPSSLLVQRTVVYRLTHGHIMLLSSFCWELTTMVLSIIDKKIQISFVQLWWFICLLFRFDTTAVKQKAAGTDEGKQHRNSYRNYNSDTAVDSRLNGCDQILYRWYLRIVRKSLISSPSSRQ